MTVRTGQVLPGQHRWQRMVGTLMIWLTAAMVTLSVVTAGAFLALLLWFAGSWLTADGMASGGLWLRFWMNLQQLLFQPSATLGVEAMLPAIIGTVVMIILMTLIVAPLGVLVAVYLSEYAKNTWYTDLVRIAIQNLAGVPSVIFGVFGLGFFVYTVGGEIDSWFYADTLPRPTFGTPGLLWASLTLALLTLPVVIVASEEGLARLPASMREGSYALGATRFETIVRVLLPAAGSSVLTGVILAIARAAGEVAPLMLVGVVKYAPTLPVSLQAPFIAFEQKFMHLGFFIYDVAAHANVGTGRLGLICAAAVLLVGLVMLLNLTAVLLRKRLRDRYQALSEE